MTSRVRFTLADVLLAVSLASLNNNIDSYRNAVGASSMLNTLCMLTTVLTIKALPTDLDRHRSD